MATGVHDESAAQSRPGPGLSENLALLMRDVARGEVTALSNLYVLTAERVLAQARFKVRSREDAEEIIIDVFTYVWRNAASYDPTRGSVMAWLSVMTRNRAIDLLRKREASVSITGEHVEVFALSNSDEIPTPEQLVSREQTRRALDTALQSVDELRRQLIRMAFFDGLTHEEIAQAVGLPLGTVKSHLRRTLAVLRQSASLLVSDIQDASGSALRG